MSVGGTKSAGAAPKNSRYALRRIYAKDSVKYAVRNPHVRGGRAPEGEKMTIRTALSDFLPEQVVAATTECRANFSCLCDGSCGEKPMCEVDFSCSQTMAFVFGSDFNCAYHADFGDGHVCMCPVRVALHHLEN